MRRRTSRLVRIDHAARKRVFGAMRERARVTAAFFEPLPVNETKGS
jgi:hypothetical protein